MRKIIRGCAWTFLGVAVANLLVAIHGCPDNPLALAAAFFLLTIVLTAIYLLGGGSDA